MNWLAKRHHHHLGNAGTRHTNLNPYIFPKSRPSILTEPSTTGKKSPRRPPHQVWIKEPVRTALGGFGAPKPCTSGLHRCPGCSLCSQHVLVPKTQKTINPNLTFRCKLWVRMLEYCGTGGGLPSNCIQFFVFLILDLGSRNAMHTVEYRIWPTRCGFGKRDAT